MIRTRCDRCGKETDHEGITERPYEFCCVVCGRHAPVPAPTINLRLDSPKRSTTAAVIGLVVGAILCGPVAYIFMRSCIGWNSSPQYPLFDAIIAFFALAGYCGGPLLGWGIAWLIQDFVRYRMEKGRRRAFDE